jgi:hypothetical protein
LFSYLTGFLWWQEKSVSQNSLGLLFLLPRAVSKPLDRFENGFVRFLWDPTKIEGKIGVSDEQRT